MAVRKAQPPPRGSATEKGGIAVNKPRRRGGFTLAELLIVIAIIGILTAIAIPLFSSMLGSAKERTCLANRTSLYHEVFYADMIKGSSVADEFPPEVLKEKGYVCPSREGALAVSYDPVTHRYTVKCSVHGGGDADFDFANLIDKTLSPGGELFEYLEELAKKGRTSLPRIDSNAPNGGNYKDTVQKLLEKASGNTLGVGMTATWSMSEMRLQNGAADPNYQLFWSSVDISQCSAGDKILVMRYNNNYKGSPTYIAAWATVTQQKLDGKGDPYPVIDQESFINIDDSAEKDFSSAYALFQKTLSQEGGTRHGGN